MTPTQSDSTDQGGSTFLTAKPEPKAEPKPDPNAIDPNKKPDDTKPAATTAPEKYTDFKLPDGYEFDPKAKTAFETTAKELNLTQEGAQKLIDIWSEHAAASAKAPYDLWAKTQQEWHDKILERFGGEDGANKVSADINKALDRVLPPSLRASFRSALDFTGAGSNPDLIEGLTLLLKPHMEGKPVLASKPSPEGQKEPNQPSAAAPIDAAAAMYPHLVKNRQT